MKLIFLINFLVSSIIFFFLLKGFLKNYRDKRTGKITQILFIIGLLYLVLGGISLLWFFDILIYNSNDYLIIYSILIIIQSLLLFGVIFLFSLNKNLFYFLFLYLMNFFSLFLPIFNFFILSLIESFLLTIILFAYLTNREDVYKRIGYIGVLYSVISLVFQVLLLVGIGDVYIFSLFSNLFFLILIFNLLADLKKYPLLHLEYSNNKEKPYFLVLLRHFIFIIVLTNFIFIGTLGIHELGHFGISKLYNCESGKIIYEGNFLHTEVLCKNLPDNILILLGGILIPVLLAVVLFLIGDNFIRDVSILIIGFNLIASNRDFTDLGVSDNFVMLSLFIGAIFLIIGIIMFVKSKVDSNLGYW